MLDVAGPADVAIDGAGKLHVVDVASRVLRTVTPSGTVATVAGSTPISGSADGTGATARFDHPGGVAVDSADNLCVADTSNSTRAQILRTPRARSCRGSSARMRWRCSTAGWLRALGRVEVPAAMDLALSRRS